jgi:hypothetical protein
MNGDPEFEEFLKRRRPLFRRDVDDGLEPPAELDRIVLRQARAAIEDERPVSIVFRAGMPTSPHRVPEVRVESISERVEYPPAEVAPVPASPPAARASADGAEVVDLSAPSSALAWRSDARAWKAEIDRLRASGDAARADAEQAEFNRQFRAYATSPDR